MKQRLYVTVVRAGRLLRFPGRGKRPDDGGTLRVLMYHKVTAVRPNTIAVSPESFNAQQQFLARNYRVVSLGEVRRWFHGEASLPTRAVLLTFDDGYRDNLEVAHPVLAKIGHPAAIFVPTDFIESSVPLPHDARLPIRNPTLTWDELRALQDVFEVGSHGCSHRPLTRLPLEEARRELRESKLTLEKRLGKPVYAFSYPKDVMSSPSDPTCRDLLSSSAERVRAGVQTVELEEAPSEHRNGT